MVEGLVYKITNFGVMRNGGNFRACGHKFKLSFDANTKITLVPTAAISYTGLPLIKSSNIRKTNGHSPYLFDFMGIVNGVSEEINLNKQGRATRLMLLDMVDEMGTSDVLYLGSWWKPFLVSLLHLEQDSLLLLFKREGLISIRVRYPVAVEFKNSLTVHEIETDVANSIISDRARPIYAREEFLQLYPRKKVGQLHEMVEEGFFIVMATIKEIVEEERWWYTTCTCLKAVNFAPGYPYYDDYKRVFYDMSPRYKIKVLVSAGDDNAHLIMFDSECFSLLNKFCRDLLSDCKGEETGGIPPEILNFVGNELLFRIERKEDIFFLVK